MKYIYIICLSLSSLFVFTPLKADTHTHNNAFFIPSGAFQQNTGVKDITPKKPRRTQPAQKTSPEQVFQSKPQTINAPKQQVIQAAAHPAKTTAPEKTTPQTQPQPTPKKPAKYKLDDSPVKKPEIQTTNKQDIPPLQKFQQKSLKEMLSTLPYPDFDQPKFKQIYALYALELRSAYRRGKLPSNHEQEEILAKANSIRRFEVK